MLVSFMLYYQVWQQHYEKQAVVSRWQDRKMKRRVLNRNTYGPARSLLLVQRGAKERQIKNYNENVNYIRDVTISKVLCYFFGWLSLLSYNSVAPNQSIALHFTCTYTHTKSTAATIGCSLIRSYKSLHFTYVFKASVVFIFACLFLCLV